jgi:hypothetical protein
MSHLSSVSSVLLLSVFDGESTVQRLKMEEVELIC